VEVRTAPIAGVAEADALAGRQLEGRLARKALHLPRLADRLRACQAWAARLVCAGMHPALRPIRERRPARRLPWSPTRAGAVTVALLLALSTGSARAQAPGPDLNDLVLDWARGRYASPLHCEMGGEPVRGLRRLLVTPGPPHIRPPVDVLVFVKLEVDEATRCFTELESRVPNIWGRVQIRLPGASHPDTAVRDFSVMIRRKGGFDFDIPAGRLVLAPVGDAGGAPRNLDFQGGHARMSEVHPGTDAYRMLADLVPGRLVLLELETRDGERLELPLVRTDER
jgi:hypothetical protein